MLFPQSDYFCSLYFESSYSLMFLRAPLSSQETLFYVKNCLTHLGVQVELLYLLDC